MIPMTWSNLLYWKHPKDLFKLIHYIGLTFIIINSPSTEQPSCVMYLFQNFFIFYLSSGHSASPENNSVNFDE